MFQTSLASQLNSVIDRRLNKYFKFEQDPKGRLYKIRRIEQRKLKKIVRAKYELAPGYTFTKDDETKQYKFLAQQYPNQKFEDIEFIKEILQSFLEVVESNIVGSLQAQLVLNGNNLNYSIYAQINRVRKNYYEHENALQRKIYEVRNIITFCNQYFIQNKEDVMKKFLDKKDITIDEYNMNLFEQMMTNLDNKVSTLYQAVFNNFEVFFDDLLKVHMNFEIDDQEKILKLLKMSANLIAFYKDQIKTQVEYIIDLTQLLQTSPKYQHVKLYNLQENLFKAKENTGINEEKLKIEKIEKEVEKAEEKNEQQKGEDEQQDQQKNQEQSQQQNDDKHDVQNQENRRLNKNGFITKSFIMMLFLIFV